MEILIKADKEAVLKPGGLKCSGELDNLMLYSWEVDAKKGGVAVFVDGVFKMGIGSLRSDKSLEDSKKRDYKTIALFDSDPDVPLDIDENTLWPHEIPPSYDLTVSDYGELVATPSAMGGEWCRESEVAQKIRELKLGNAKDYVTISTDNATEFAQRIVQLEKENERLKKELGDANTPS